MTLFSLFLLCDAQNCSIKNCENCSKDLVCTTCIPGFTNSDNDGVACYLIDACSQPACVNCLDDTCTMCLQGYSLQDEGMCIKCPNKCISCTSNGQCLICASNYVLDNGNCSIFTPYCLHASNPYVCDQCQIGSYVDNTGGQCSSCLNSCLSCTNSSNCYLCLNGYYLSITKGKTICSVCDPSCSNCSGTSTNCTFCNLDSYLVNNDCSPCESSVSFCITCVLPNNSSIPICLSCQSGMFVSLNGSCSRCPEGCFTCTNATICLTCKASFFLNTQNLCQPCSENCIVCSNNSTCKFCIIFFTVVTNSTNKYCVQCPSNCQTCLQPTKCIKCLASFYLNSTSKMCSPCMQNCFKCVSQFDCSSCEVSFYNVSFEGRVKCIKCPKLCPVCNLDSNNQLQCKSCHPGYHFISLDNICLPCPVQNCFSCRETYATNSCAICNSGFYLTEQGHCIQCSQGCGICQNISCEICADGYFYQTGKCIVCSSGCSNCNSTTCFICAQGFFLSSSTSSSSQSQSQSQCQSCPQGCLSCVAENICNLCFSGYFLLSPSLSQPFLLGCAPCTKPCSICQSNSTCLRCQRGFTLNSLGQCSPCPGNFSFCERGYVFQCLDSFALVSNVKNLNNEISEKCVPCADGCAKCKYEQQNRSTICFSCSLGLTLTITGECFQCGMTKTTEGCLSCTSSGSCDSCFPGYTLYQDKCSNQNFEFDSEWSLIGADIALCCLSMILIISLLIQRSQSKVNPSSIIMELTDIK